jgi:WD40 repeat protein
MPAGGPQPWTPGGRAVKLDRVPGPPLPEAAVSVRPRRWWFAALVLVTSGGLHPRPAGADDADPLPPGAKARYGPGRLAARAGAVPAPPDYATFLVAGPDGSVRAYDLATGRPVKGDADPAPRPSAVGRVAAVSADGRRAVAVRPDALSVRDVATGEEVAELRGGGLTNPGAAVSVSADGSVVAHGGPGRAGRGEVVVWDVAKNAVLGRVPPGPPGTVVPVLSPDGGRVAAYTPFPAPVAGKGGQVPPADPVPVVAVWEVGGKELFKARLPAAGSQVGVAFSPDGKTLATGSGEGPIDLWEVPSGKPARTLLGRTGQGGRVAFSADGKELAAVAADGTIQRWSLPDGQPAGTTDPPADLPPVQPGGVGFAPGGRVVAWGLAGAATLVWEAPSGKLLTPVGEHVGAIRSIGFGTGGKDLVTAGSDGRIVRWDVASGKPLGPVPIRPPRAGGFTSPNPGTRGPLLLAADATRAVSASAPAAVFDLATGSELFALPRPPAARFVAYSFPSADLSRVAVLAATSDSRATGRCTVWDLANQRRVADFDLAAVGGFTPAAAFSPGGNRLVTVTYSRDPSLTRQGVVVTGWDLATGRKLGEVEEPGNPGPVAVAVANDTSAVVGFGGRLWAVDYEAGRRGDEVENLQPPGRVNPPPAPVVAFAPGGDRFAAGVVADPEAGVYGVRVYDWPRGRVLHTFAGHAGPVTALRWSADGKVLASGSADTTVLLWDVAGLGEKK